MDESTTELDAVRAARKAAQLAGAMPTDPPFAGIDVPGYDIIRELHRGGQGIVHEGVQRSTRRTVAVKLLREGPFATPADQARFEREVRLLAELRYPRIVTIHDSGRCAMGHYLVMDYITGDSLDVYLERTHLSVSQALWLWQKICEAIQFAHLRGIMHRDLKPRNIQVDESGEPHVLDFGLARRTEHTTTTGTALTQTGFVGSLPWSAPEQVQGRPEGIDARADIYALGVIGYQMLTGRFPYDVTGSAVEVFERILRASPQRPCSLRPDLGDEIETIVLRCLAKERERRYQSAGELAQDIERYLSGYPIEAKRDSRWYVFRKAVQRNRLATIAGAAIVVSLALGLGLALGAWRTADLAREELAHRADELSRVVAFQSMLLGRVNPEAFGAEIVDRFARRIADEIADPELRAAEVERWRQRTRSADPTTVALEILSGPLIERTIAAIDEQFGQQPLLRARLLQSAATTLVELGALDAALAPQKRALDLRRVALGDDHPDTIESIHELGRLLQARGESTAAESYFREALAACQRTNGEQAPSTLRCWGSLASLAIGPRGDLEAAEAPARRAFTGLRDQLGDDDPETIRARANLGFLCRLTNRLEEAEELLGGALESAERVLGREHPSTLVLIDLVGDVLLARGKLDEARRHFQSALATARRLFGDDHSLVRAILANLARLHREAGDLVQAEATQRELIASLRRVHGEAHADYLTALAELGSTLRDRGQLEQAEMMYQAALDGRRTLLGEAHPDTDNSRRNLDSLHEMRRGAQSARPEDGSP